MKGDPIIEQINLGFHRLFASHRICTIPRRPDMTEEEHAGHTETAPGQEQHEPQPPAPEDAIQFVASIPNKASAISFEGEDRGGGELKLAFSGTEVAPIVRLLAARGRPLLVTVAPQQRILFPEPPEEEIPAGDGMSESLYRGTPVTVSPSGPTIQERVGPANPFPPVRARKAKRNLLSRARKKAKR